MGAPRRSSRKGKGRHSQTEVPVNLAGAQPSKYTKPPPTPKSSKKLSSVVKNPTKLSTSRGRGRPRKQVAEKAKSSPTPIKKAAPPPNPKKPVVAPAVKQNVKGKRGRKPVRKLYPKKSDKVVVQKKSMVDENLQLKQIMEIEAKAAAIETEIRVQLRGLQDSIKSLQKQISK